VLSNISENTPHSAANIHTIRSDEEAVDIVSRLADEFRREASKRDRERLLPTQEIDMLTREGFFGISVPRTYGGADVSATTIAHAFRMLGAADPSIAQIPQNHFTWLSVLTQGTESQRKFFFGRIMSGDRIGNAHSESTKNRPRQYTHTLTRVEGGWRMTGKKYYSTGAIFARWIPFTDIDENGNSKMFFADATAEGLEVIDDWEGMGQRTTASGTTVFNNVFVPDEYVFPFATAQEGAHSFLYYAQLIHTAIDVGIAEETLEDARHYIHAHNRPWLGNPFDEHAKEPFVIAEFGKLGLKVRTARSMLDRAAASIDAVRSTPTAENIIAARIAVADARVVSAEVAVEVSSDFFAITGAHATLPEFGLDRHWRNARTHSLHDPIRWKYFHLGNYYLNDVIPDGRSYI